MRQHTSRAIGLILFSAILVTAGRAEAEEIEIFNGSYHYVGGDKQRIAFRRAIDKVVDQMNIVIRGIARNQLASRLKIEPRMDFQVEGGQVRITHEPLPTRITKLDGSLLRLTNRSGDRISVSYRREGRAIIEVIQSGRSSQTNLYRFSPEGAGLTFSAAIRSPMLPEAIRYSLTYRRRSSVEGAVVRR
jgi:hypothetical protein